MPVAVQSYGNMHSGRIAIATLQRTNLDHRNEYVSSVISSLKDSEITFDNNF